MRKKLGIVALLICVVLVYCGCAAATEAEMPGAPAEKFESATNDYYTGDVEEYGFAMDSGEAPIEMEMAANGEAAEEELPGGEENVQKLIVTADMQLLAGDPLAAAEALGAKAEQLGGYVSDSDMRSDDTGVYYASATLRVEPDKLDELVTAAQTLGKVERYTTGSEEITQEYWDVQARLKNAKAQEAQLLELMKECTTVEETLQVRQALNDVQMEIEGYQGRIKLWDHQVKYSTLYLTVQRTPTAEVATDNNISIWDIKDVWQRMKTGFGNTAKGLVNLFYFVLIVLAYLAIPLAILAVIVLVIVLAIKAAAKSKKKTQGQK